MDDFFFFDVEYFNGRTQGFRQACPARQQQSIQNENKNGEAYPESVILRTELKQFDHLHTYYMGIRNAQIIIMTWERLPHATEHDR